MRSELARRRWVAIGEIVFLHGVSHAPDHHRAERPLISRAETAVCSTGLGSFVPAMADGVPGTLQPTALKLAEGRTPSRWVGVTSGIRRRTHPVQIRKRAESVLFANLRASIAIFQITAPATRRASGSVAETHPEPGKRTAKIRSSR